MNIITNNQNLNNEEKRYWIERICLHSLNIQIYSDEFLNSLKSKKNLSEYFSKENHPDTRLDKALEKYSRNENFEETIEIKLHKCVFRMKDMGIIKYLNKK